MGTPDYNSYINEAFGWPDESGGDVDFEDWGYFQSANNLIIGPNPPYSASDFLAFYPNFGGLPTVLSGTTDGTTGVITALPNVTGLAVGQLVAGAYIPDGATIKSINSSTSVTLNLSTTIAGTGPITFYVSPLVPLAVINVYIVLASASLMQLRWDELWTYAMALYVAHMCTLWLQAQSAPPGSTAAAVAASGLAIGIRTSKAVQDVSTSSTILSDLEGWGAYQLTIYGQELATYAKTIGSGAMLIW